MQEDEEELQAIYEDIPLQFVVKPEKMEVTSIFAGTSFLVLLIGGVWLTWNASKLLSFRAKPISFRFVFRDINLFALLVALVISIDKFIV